MMILKYANKFVFFLVYIIIIMFLILTEMSCKFLQSNDIKKNDLGYRFRLTKDSTVIGAWGTNYFHKGHVLGSSTSGFHLFVIYSKDSIMYVPMEPQKYDTTVVEKHEELKELNYALHPFPYTHEDYTIESPKQATRYILAKNGDHYELLDGATELVINERGDLIINYKSWASGDTVRGLELRLNPYKFKTIKINQ
jgi:hypothetical protein